MTWRIALRRFALSGLSVGSIYAIVALALAIPFKASRVLNFAQGVNGDARRLYCAGADVRRCALRGDGAGDAHHRRAIRACGGASSHSPHHQHSRTHLGHRHLRDRPDHPGDYSHSLAGQHLFPARLLTLDRRSRSARYASTRRISSSSAAPRCWSLCWRCSSGKRGSARRCAPRRSTRPRRG